VPSGLWCYRVGRERWLLGGAVNDVGRIDAWLRNTLLLPESDVLAAVLGAPAAAHTPLVLPFLSGERSIGWAADARAVLSGISAGTTAPALYRGAMEGVAVTYARVASQLRQVTGAPARVVASGRVARENAGLLRLLADVLQTPLDPVLVKRATLRGAAVLALQEMAPDVRRNPPTGEPTIHPRAGDAAYYRALEQRFEDLYATVVQGSRDA
jgi:gluconokinase